MEDAGDGDGNMFIELTDVEGCTILLNVDHIGAILQKEEITAISVLDTDDWLGVKQSYAEVRRLISATATIRAESFQKQLVLKVPNLNILDDLDEGRKAIVTRIVDGDGYTVTLDYEIVVDDPDTILRNDFNG